MKPLKKFLIISMSFSAVFLFLPFEGHSLVKNKKSLEGASFEISKKAVKFMQVKTVQIKSSKSGEFDFPRSSLITYGEKKGIYKYDGEFFTLIELSNVKKRNKSLVTAQSNLLTSGDLIVVNGAPLLRVVHLKSFERGGHGHAH